MSEHIPERERLLPNEAQDASLRGLCERYGVSYVAEHYVVYPPDSFMMAGWAEGWLGGPQHATGQAGRPTIYVGVSPEGEVHS